MEKSDATNEISLETLKELLARNVLGIDDLNDLIATIADPEKLKLLLAALETAMAKEAKRAEKLEDDARKIRKEAKMARARVRQAEEVIRVLLAKIEAEQAPQPPTPKIG